MFECLHCGGEFSCADTLMNHLDTSPACARREHEVELDSLPELSALALAKLEAARRERRFATDPVERQRAGNRRAEDKGSAK